MQPAPERLRNGLHALASQDVDLVEAVAERKAQDLNKLGGIRANGLAGSSHQLRHYLQHTCRGNECWKLACSHKSELYHAVCNSTSALTFLYHAVCNSPSALTVPCS